MIEALVRILTLDNKMVASQKKAVFCEKNYTSKWLKNRNYYKKIVLHCSLVDQSSRFGDIFFIEKNAFKGLGVDYTYNLLKYSYKYAHFSKTVCRFNIKFS